MQDIVGPETPGHFDRQAFPGELVDDGEHAELAPVPRPVLDEVIGPDVPGPRGPRPQAGSIVEPEAPSPGLPARDLQSLPSPDAVHPLDVHPPAVVPEQSRDRAAAVAPIVLGVGNDRLAQPFLVVSPSGPSGPSCSRWSPPDSTTAGHR